MDDIPHPRLIGFVLGLLGMLLVIPVANAVFHEPPGAPRQVYVIE